MRFQNVAVKVFLVIELMLSIMMFLPSGMAVEEQPWVKFAGNPVLSPTPGSWDSVGVENPNIITGNLGFMLFYDGISETNAGSIGLAQPPMGFQIPEFAPSLLGVLVGVTLLVAISLVELDNRRRR